MIDHTYLRDFGVHHLRVRDPFSLDEFRALLSGGAPFDDVDMPPLRTIIIDLRGVDLSGLTDAEMRRHAMFKSTVDKSKTNVNCAYLVDSVEAQAKVRLALVYSALSDVTSEAKTLVSERPDEVGNWVSGLMPETPPGLVGQLEALKDGSARKQV
ncbi:hypothetical protein [Maritimibacter alexandrii]|uniref:hypothetical protein n=1 Tax=Maritimibacter alexandrii TaxID=2570355 RepID=UPI001107B351|nr:hypothetical protein [Maritimibacter alexandrii]